MIAIPNMSKPKSCAECEFNYCLEGGSYEWWECVILHDDINQFDTRRTDCPLIDIVTCGECKWLGVDDGMPFCYWWLREIEPDVFCSYGERRTDE